MAKIITSKIGFDPLTVNLDQICASLYPNLPSAPILADIANNIDPLTNEGLAVQTKFDAVITAGIALTHTSFNVANVLIFLPLVGLLAKLVTKLVPDKKVKEAGHLTYLDVRMLDTPALGIVQSQGQLNFMAESVEGMMDQLRCCLENKEETTKIESKIFKREEILDNVQKEIFLFLGKLVSGEVPLEISETSNQQMRIADEYESLSDYIANALKGIKRLEENQLQLDGPAKEKILALHDRVAAYIVKIDEIMKTQNSDQLIWAITEGAAIGQFMKDSRRENLERLQKEEVSPLFSLTYTDMLNFYRRMKDHALNIAEVVSGEK